MPKNYLYNNNYEVETTVLLTDTGVIVTVESTAGLTGPATDSFDVLLLTISHPTDGSLVEIVSVLNVSTATTLNITRGQEGTTAVEWPVGSVVSARVTAGMYVSYAGGLADGEVVIKGSNVDVGKTPVDVAFINTKRHPSIDFQRHIGGYDYIAPFERWAGAMTDPGLAARNTVQPVTIYSDPFNLGDSPVWAAGSSQPYGRVVFPTVRNGYAYIATAFGPYYKGGLTGGTEPVWPTTEMAEVVDNGITWVAIKDDIVQMHLPPGLVFYPESVGFIGKYQSGAVQPTIYFSGDNEVEDWLLETQTTNLSDSFRMQKYDVRPNAGASALLDARVGVPGTGEYLGRFFWTGFIDEWQ